jgi:hypothetical protein
MSVQLPCSYPVQLMCSYRAGFFGMGANHANKRAATVQDRRGHPPYTPIACTATAVRPFGRLACPFSFDFKKINPRRRQAGQPGTTSRCVPMCPAHAHGRLEWRCT